MFKYLLILSMILLISGCGRQLSTEALDQARIAIESGEYSQGSLLLLMASEDLHAQSVYLLRMIDYQAAHDLMGMVYAWMAINAIQAEEDFVHEAAYHMLRTTLNNATIVDSD
ncbi:MAG: hypothetical protein FWG67_09810 [Defluviitaleaceae bacterium]|nr:hypothetical protein [Defluviitaleaceae bacterium]